MEKLSYKNISIAYSDEGSGKAVVLLHGFLENSSMWQHLVPTWKEKNRIICIDLLGHGQTSCIGYLHTMEDMADAVYFVLHYLKIKKATIIGHSMGGYVALAFAELYPESISGLLLLNSTAVADSLEKVANRDRAILAVKKNYKTAVSMAIANLFSPLNRERLSSEIEYAKREALKTPLQGIIAAQEGMKIRKDRQILLHTTAFPKMLILGEKDTILDYESTKEQVVNTSVKLVTFNDGHMSHFENKEELEQVVVDFLT